MNKLYFGNFEAMVGTTLLAVMLAVGLIGPSTALGATATAVDLGTAGDFAVLSKTAISSTGSTNITGDIGTSPSSVTAITGFSLMGVPANDTFLTSVQLLGYKAYAANMQPPTPVKMTTAISDMETAYTAATGGANVAGVGTFLDIGAGTVSTQTITPGVYTWGADVSIIGDLTLDCSLEPAGVFVFQVAGNLELASGTDIILTGCDVSNIFWGVGGTTFLQSTSHFEGTLIAGPATSEITVVTGASINGRLLGEKTIALQAGTTVVSPDAGSPATGPVFIDSNTNGSLNSGELYFTTIQDAVNTAVSGDTIVVGVGTYAEHVAISKSLTLKGENAGIAGNATRAGESIVDGSDTDAAFAITANDVTIDGFTVRNGSNGSYFSGIWSQTGTQNLNVLNNVITQNGFGVWAQCGDNCLIKGNLFDSNNKSNSPGSGALSADSTTNLTISNNEFKNDTAGNPILLQAVAPGAHTNVIISNNSFHNNAYTNMYVLGVSGGTFSGNTITPATDATGISFSGADMNVTVTNNVITGGGRGIRIEDAGYYGESGGNSNITINKNSFANDSEYGVGNLSGYVGGVDATQNWWGAANGPSDLIGGDGSTPDTNAGGGSKATGAVNYASWCVNETCTTPGSSNSQGSRSHRRATPAIPAIPGVRPAIPALPSANSNRTVAATLFTFVRDLSQGSQGVDVTELQNRLTREGVYTGPITGYFGPLTMAGVKAYQRMLRIIDTGYVGPLTRAELNRGTNRGNSNIVLVDSVRLQLISLIQQLIVKLQAELDAKQ